MAESKTRGPIQIHSNDPAEINRALAQLVEWIDELSGLRGANTVYDTLKYKDTKGEVLHGFGNPNA